MDMIRISNIAGSADTADQGELAWAGLVEALRLHDTVTVSFAGVSTATSSFVNVSFVRLLEIMTFSEVKRRIRVVDSSKQINDLIKSRLTREALIAA